MAQPAAVIFALSMAVWVADVRFAPAPALLSAGAPGAVCDIGFSPSAPAGTDAELVTCATRIGQ